MFSGIIEAKSCITEVLSRDSILQIRVDRPAAFSDIKVGDSIATDGVCLTVEAFSDSWIQFAIGFETLKVTGWTKEQLQNKLVNLERSLRFGDRLHGHMVSGHVETVGKVVGKRFEGENLLLDVIVPNTISQFVWKKGSIAIQGVSLTVNEVENDVISVCLIPETLQITNLKNLQVNETVNLEADYFAKAIYHFSEKNNAARI